MNTFTWIFKLMRLNISDHTNPPFAVVVAQLLSCANCLATTQTVTRQASLSMTFFRQEYWCVLLFPPSRDLLNPRTELESLALSCGFFTLSHQGSPTLGKAQIFIKYISDGDLKRFQMTWHTNLLGHTFVIIWETSWKQNIKKKKKGNSNQDQLF